MKGSESLWGRRSNALQLMCAARYVVDIIYWGLKIMFDVQNLPDLTGKVAVVTGGNSGLGFETCKALAANGARVIMACRNEGKAKTAASAIRDVVPNAALDFVRLDLGDLASVKACAAELTQREQKIDLLINNAGLMSGSLAHTNDGHELQFGTNHLGHFVLNAELLPLVEAAAGRIVVLGSASHNFVKRYAVDDVNWERRDYNVMQSYAQSKLANMLYLRALAARLKAKGSSALAVMAHPGFAATNIGNTPDADRAGKVAQIVTRLASKLFAQSQAQGAWPTLMAATDPQAAQGDYYGPTGFGEWRGKPGKVSPAPIAQDDANAAALWAKSEELTGVTFTI